MEQAIEKVFELLGTADQIVWTRALLLLAVLGLVRMHLRYAALVKEGTEKDAEQAEAIRSQVRAADRTAAALESLRESVERSSVLWLAASGRLAPQPPRSENSENDPNR